MGTARPERSSLVPVSDSNPAPTIINVPFGPSPSTRADIDFESGAVVSLEPEHVFFARKPLVTFNSWESSVARQPDTFAEIAAWGSRYPHHDASGPDEALATLRKWSVPDAVMARYMGGNAARQFGLT